MGLLTFYLGYRHAKARQRQRQRSEDSDDQEICDNCGWERHRHSDDGDCPTY